MPFIRSRLRRVPAGCAAWQRPGASYFCNMLTAAVQVKNLAGLLLAVMPAQDGQQGRKKIQDIT